MHNKFAVIGLGHFGMRIARTLANRGAEVMAIDNNQEMIDFISDEVAYAVRLDATDIKALKAQNIMDMSAVVVAIGEDFESLLLCTTNLIDLGVERIISRAGTSTQKRILEKLGIREILSPEDEVGIAVAQKLLNPDIINFLPLPDEYEVAEVKSPEGILDKPLIDLKLREKYNLNLITIKREFDKDGGQDNEDGNREERQMHVIGVPTGATEIKKNDSLILMGKKGDIQRFLDINQ